MGNSPKLDTLKQSSSGVVGISAELLHVLNEKENPSIIITEQDGEITTSSIQKTRGDIGNLSSPTEPPCTFLPFIWLLHQLINIKIKIQRKLDSKFFHEHFLQKPLERVLFVSDW